MEWFNKIQNMVGDNFNMNDILKEALVYLNSKSSYIKQEGCPKYDSNINQIMKSSIPETMIRKIILAEERSGSSAVLSLYSILHSLNILPTEAKIIAYFNPLKYNNFEPELFLRDLNIVTHSLTITGTNINEGEVINEILYNSKFPSEVLRPNRKIGEILYDSFRDLIQTLYKIIDNENYNKLSVNNIDVNEDEKTTKEKRIKHVCPHCLNSTVSTIRQRIIRYLDLMMKRNRKH